MRMRAEIEMPAEYQGRVVSRSQALKTAGKSSKGHGRKGNDAELEDDEDDDESNNDEAVEEEVNSDSDEELVDSDDGGEDDNDDESDEDHDKNEVDRSMADVEELEAEQAAHVMKLVQVESKDREKAQHARNQRALRCSLRTCGWECEFETYVLSKTCMRACTREYMFEERMFTKIQACTQAHVFIP